jgi:hypothetical protein
MVEEEGGERRMMGRLLRRQALMSGLLLLPLMVEHWGRRCLLSCAGRCLRLFHVASRKCLIPPMLVMHLFWEGRRGVVCWNSDAAPLSI